MWQSTTLHADTNVLDSTAKRPYVSGGGNKLRVRYDRIMNFKPFSGGFSIIRDAQTAKTQTFRTGDG